MLTRRNPLQTGGRNATDVADAAVAAWTEIDRRLTPTIGRGGVAALFRRSVHLAQARRPWLARVFEASADAWAATALRAALAEQDADVAAAAADELVTTFRGLLIGLIGEELTRQLMAPGSATGTRSRLPKDSPP